MHCALCTIPNIVVHAGMHVNTIAGPQSLHVCTIQQEIISPEFAYNTFLSAIFATVDNPNAKYFVD